MYQLYRENVPLGPMSVRYVPFSQTVLAPNTYDTSPSYKLQ